MQKIINIGNGRETIDINETVTIFKLTSVLGSREPIATGRVRNRQYITGSKAIQGQVEDVKPDPRAEPDQDKDQRRSSNHTSGAAAPEEARNKEDKGQSTLCLSSGIPQETSCHGNKPANDSVL